jgi:hypothetical protein
MRRIKHHFRSVSQLLMVGLLSCCVVLMVGLLSCWLVVLRLIKHILKRKEKKEETKEIKFASIADTGESPVLSPKVEPEQKTAATKVESEKHTIYTEVEPEQNTTATKVEPEQNTTATKVEPEQNSIHTKVKTGGGVLATEVIEAYCVKCRQRRTIQGAKKVTTQKGRHAIEGTCPVCGTKLFRFIAREKKTLSEEE